MENATHFNTHDALHKEIFGNEKALRKWWMLQKDSNRRHDRQANISNHLEKVACDLGWKANTAMRLSLPLKDPLAITCLVRHNCRREYKAGTSYEEAKEVIKGVRQNAGRILLAGEEEL